MDAENGADVEDCGGRNVSSSTTTETGPLRTRGSRLTTCVIILVPSASLPGASCVRSQNPPPLAIQPIFDSGRVSAATAVRSLENQQDCAAVVPVELRKKGHGHGYATPAKSTGEGKRHRSVEDRPTATRGWTEFGWSRPSRCLHVVWTSRSAYDLPLSESRNFSTRPQSPHVFSDPQERSSRHLL